MEGLRIFEFPLSVILAVIFLLVTFIGSYGMGKSGILASLAGRKASVVMCLALAVLLSVDGVWGLGLFHSWYVFPLVALVLFSLGLVTIDGIKKRKSGAYIISHLGLYLLLLGGFFGAPDSVEARLAVGTRTPAHMAITAAGEAVPLPFGIRLEEFSTEFYEDGVSPRQYTSTLEVDGKRLKTSVNHPLHYKGYSIYQSDYDREYGCYSVLLVVKDPWLPVVYLGMALLVIACLLDLRRTWNSRAVWPLVVVLAMAFCAISMARINLGTLMPALRSLWFIPHIIIYMLAYSVLALALILGVAGLFGKNGWGELSGKLLATASSLLLLGMLCGAVWAKAAWGDYWTWDGKECWAAVTWMLTLAGTHLHSNRKKLRTLMILLAFLAMQVTWYGVNYLPSAQYSLHTYNKE